MCDMLEKAASKACIVWCYLSCNAQVAINLSC